MGCTCAISNKSRISLVKPKGPNSLTLSVLMAPKDQAPSEAKCLKIRLQETQDDLAYNIRVLSSLSVGSLPSIETLYQICSKFESALSYFEMLIHGICIPNYDFLKGITVFLLYLKINTNAQASLKMSPNIPFIEIQINNKKWDQKILNAFNGVVSSLKEFKNTSVFYKILNEIKSEIKDLKVNGIQNSIKFKLLNNVIVFGTKIEKLFTKTYQDLKYISENSKKVYEDIDNVIPKLEGVNAESLEKIVHAIFLQ